jgi:hypothetical protein
VWPRITATFEFSDTRVRWNLERDLAKYTPRFNVAPVDQIEKKIREMEQLPKSQEKIEILDFCQKLLQIFDFLRMHGAITSRTVEPRMTRMMPIK